MRIPECISWLLGRIGAVLNDCHWNETYKIYRKKYTVSNSFSFNGAGVVLYGDGEIVLGENSYIGRCSSIQSGPGRKVAIGKCVSISHNVKIYTVNRDADSDYSLSSSAVSAGDVIIGDYCWIGAGVFIKEGVTIGENTAIGANSVVVNDIPSHCIAAGAPAKVIKVKHYAQDKQGHQTAENTTP